MNKKINKILQENLNYLDEINSFIKSSLLLEESKLLQILDNKPPILLQLIIQYLLNDEVSLDRKVWYLNSLLKLEEAEKPKENESLKIEFI